MTETDTPTAVPMAEPAMAEPTEAMCVSIARINGPEELGLGKTEGLGITDSILPTLHNLLDHDVKVVGDIVGDVGGVACWTA